jgi:predicted transcriptional regulator
MCGISLLIQNLTKYHTQIFRLLLLRNKLASAALEIAAVYQFVVRSLYNVNLVQFAASLAYQFTSDERQSWQTMGHMSTCHDLELLVSRVIDLFDQLSLAPHDGYSHGPSHRAVSFAVIVTAQI